MPLPLLLCMQLLGDNDDFTATVMLPTMHAKNQHAVMQAPVAFPQICGLVVLRSHQHVLSSGSQLPEFLCCIASDLNAPGV